MSLFKEPFKREIKESLDIRQEIMGKNNRTPKELTFLNSKTSWVSLKSSVNINGSSVLAKQNVLEGGVLSLDGKLKAGVGNNDNNSYSRYFQVTQEQISDETFNIYKSFNKLGIRPMPGITSVSIQNLGAYGSTRKATINFQCWDINQLDVLEQLYMRPGYLVFLEFGRNIYPFRKSNGEIDIKQTSREINYDFFGKENINLLEELNEIHQLSIKSKGNYDGFLGYVVNYGWQIREDGGYDCKTEIISTGEILESLKSNFSYANITSFENIDKDNFEFKGLIQTNLEENSQVFSEYIKFKQKTGQTPISGSDHYKSMVEAYSNNAIMGLIKEIEFLSDVIAPKFTEFPIKTKNASFDINICKGYYQSSEKYESDSEKKNENVNTYITLGSLVDLLNTYIVPFSYNPNEEGNNVKNSPITQISTKDRKYINNSTESLKCLYNIFMTSVNPDVCVIKNTEWINTIKGVKIKTLVTEAVDSTGNLESFPDSRSNISNRIREQMISLFTRGNFEVKAFPDKPSSSSKINFLTNLQNIKNDFIFDGGKAEDFYQLVQNVYQTVRGGQKYGVFNKIDPETEESTTEKEARRYSSSKDWTTWSILNESDISYFSQNWSSEKEFWKDIVSIQTLVRVNVEIRKNFPSQDIINKVTFNSSLQTELDKREEFEAKGIASVANQKQTDNNINNTSDNYNSYLRTIKKSFNTGPNSIGRRFGIIENIYINTKFLYETANSLVLKSQDPNEKESIALINFLKQILSGVQSSIGNVNNFEVLIDDRDGIARIIDLNLVDRVNDDFEFQIGTNKSIIRNLTLESKIFKDQINMVAISSQAGGNSGQYGLDNSTLVSYNTGLTDRLLPRKDIPVTNSSDINEKNIISSLSGLISGFFKPYMENYNTDDPISSKTNFNPDKSGVYSGHLRDIIAFFTGLERYYTDNKNSMLIPTEISFTLDGISGIVIGNLFSINKEFIPISYKSGANKLGYVVLNVEHLLQNNDWTTSIKGIPFVKDSPNVRISNPTNFEVVVEYSPNTGTITVDTGAKPLSSLEGKLSGLNNVTFKKGLKGGVGPRMENAAVAIFSKLQEEYPEVKFEITDTLRTSNPGSLHFSGKALDFVIIPRITTPSSWRNVSSQSYSKGDQDKIAKIIKTLFNQGINERGYYSGVFGEESVELINEYYNPSPGATGPHFHIELAF